jgi:hypothetical protein
MPTGNSDQSTARRNPDWMLADLGRYFAWHRRTEIVNDALARKLSGLDTRTWYIERDFTIDSVSIPFLAFGPSGLFLLMATRGHWTAEHVSLLRGAADTLTETTGYRDPSHPAIVVLDDSREPRQEYAGQRSHATPTRSHQDGRGPCWVLGDYWLLGWLDSFEDRRQQRLDLLPQPVRHPPAIVAVDEAHLPPPMSDQQIDSEVRQGPARILPKGIGPNQSREGVLRFPRSWADVHVNCVAGTVGVGVSSGASGR